jgi:hypothetical protein
MGCQRASLGSWQQSLADIASSPCAFGDFAVEQFLSEEQ